MKIEKYIIILIGIILNTITGQQDYFDSMNIYELWGSGLSGENIVIMDIGPGVDLSNHASLRTSWRGSTNPTGYDWYDPVYGTQVPTAN